jgi:carbon storage regulator
VLILTRKSEQGIVIAGDVTVRVLSIEGERVKLGIDAPRSISVLREELIEEVSGQNRQAAQHLGSRGLAEQLRDLKSDLRAG